MGCLISLFESRFGGKLAANKTFRHLLAIPEVSSTEGIQNILEYAATLIKAVNVSLRWIKDIITSKVLGHLKLSVRQTMVDIKTWQKTHKFIEQTLVPSLLYMAASVGQAATVASVNTIRK